MGISCQCCRAAAMTSANLTPNSGNSRSANKLSLVSVPDKAIVSYTQSGQHWLINAEVKGQDMFNRLLAVDSKRNWNVLSSSHLHLLFLLHTCIALETNTTLLWQQHVCRKLSSMNKSNSLFPRFSWMKRHLSRNINQRSWESCVSHFSDASWLYLTKSFVCHQENSGYTIYWSMGLWEGREIGFSLHP